MKQDSQERAVRIGAVVYTLISLAVALAFIVTASVMGRYTTVAIYGGAAWVFLLTMIVTMPTITPWIKRRLAERG